LRTDSRRASSGKAYWADRVRAVGVYEDGSILRFRPPRVSTTTTTTTTTATSSADATTANTTEQKHDDTGVVGD
jgi:hypothetical protein